MAVALLPVSAACELGVDLSDARFSCESAADCPGGDACVEGFCGGPSQGASGGADGSPPAATADAATATEMLVFHPIADAWVDATQPDQNHGVGDELRVDGIPQVTAYIQFDEDQLAELEGAAYTIESARLEVFANSQHATGYEVSTVHGKIGSEGAMTYLDAPPLSDRVGSSGPISSGAWSSVTLDASMGEVDYECFALTTADDTALSLASREVDDRAPRLVLTVSVR